MAEYNKYSIQKCVITIHWLGHSPPEVWYSLLADLYGKHPSSYDGYIKDIHTIYTKNINETTINCYLLEDKILIISNDIKKAAILNAVINYTNNYKNMIISNTNIYLDSN
jgi:hypothetical protein